MPVKAGPRELKVAFLKKSSAVDETAPAAVPAADSLRRRTVPAVPRQGHDHRARSSHRPGRHAEPPPHLRLSAGDDGRRAAVRQDDPLDAGAPRLSPAGDRRGPASRCCRSIEDGRAEGGFEEGIERGLELHPGEPGVPVPRRARSGERRDRRRAIAISDLELASRLSFFLWSSIPDDELLDLAVRGKLADPAVLERQVRRMLADPRSEALVTNFAGQWLYLRNLPSHDARSASVSGLRREPAAGASAARRSCSSTASCARTAASWTC